MNWLKKVSVNPLNEESFEMDSVNSNDELRIQSVHLEREDNNISILAQLFMANHILYDVPTLLSAIPITSPQIEDIVTNEIANHFNKVQKIYVNNQLKRIQFQELKSFSKNQFKDMLKNNAIHPIVQELYFLTEKESIEDRYINISEKQQVKYKVLKEYIEPPTIINSDLTRVMWFIKNTFYLTEASFTVLPIGWELKNNLKELEILKLFNEMSDSLLITIDSENNKVLYIDCINRNIKNGA
ncbi:hypothetical protein ACH0R4_RS10310 [Bacillus cytotoxicus]|uniref:hypothetical protein n=1 Tax=Bacillus cereus group sp. BfR-BA-01492 TaxID=2920361 RepID=UPI001F5789D4|nr:hypothetical protein [Bacillus cereus group sp. BfR-BA-01492]EMA6344004.1 hypothetical protein [Bacillus cytotoxicus]